ncbi:MAG: efflux RND transporter periplasmic adaptor subunit [Pirellulales bacterium]|nr:efflux RND transporter periplasmic adaptor subunit [Pirellulales bacterium]
MIRRRPAIGPAGSVAALGLIAVVLPLVAGCETAAEVVSPVQVPKVTVAPVIEHETIDYDEYTGRTEASAAVEIRARVFGYLKDTFFKDGDMVQEGQLLFTIEPDEYQAIHEQSLSKIAVWESKLELAQAQLERRKVLLPKGAISQEEFEEYVATVREAEAALAAAKADANKTSIDLKYTEVHAPISGRIDRAYETKGTLLTGGIGAGTLLTKIVSEQPMYVYFDVDERSLLRYMRERKSTKETAPGSLRELGVPCYVQLADETDFPHQGELDFADSEVNTSTGTARVRGVFPNEDRSLVSGLYVRVRVPASERYQAMLIPERALATDQDIKYVYVVGQEGIATRRNVELGAQRGDLRIITAGLEPGEQVIVKGLQRVRPGQKVEAETETTAASSAVAVEPAATNERATEPPAPAEER